MVDPTHHADERQPMAKAVSDWIVRDVKRLAGRPPVRCLQFFTKTREEQHDARRILGASKAYSATFARGRKK
ncbi:unnamed protein product [Angiostrongylus costaricensis]|uniref:Amidohydrolase n=1 Tax=Angiostrongylus costaricensis TaxID=334426 RepID=A0A0R3PH34_ANGCS|nr:unnamed protein product [Angiostrongylus costaricensis]